ncbi:dnaJsubfamily C member 1-like [Tropilaelaps mercedesae]|uniref:DnaJsubfamily C member 1-like n=1 Tax=Tropilaelaps mercedesae TaxID=418985 RepID=A0A1V9Y238_9ACAR|nr:dnaJsubfamily C member 1-like [Tropilaelaps mercedesae]
MKILYLVTLIMCEPLVSDADLTVDDLDLFDVVEDVKQNFYEFLEIPENATTSDIRKAYRKLSLQYHPDRNSDPEAPETFRKIAAVMEVLKDEKKRMKYHEVLQYGIPDWARSMYYRYYRKARKMGPAEMGVMMAIIVTVAQTLWMWTSYWEKKFTIESNFSEAIKRKKQRSTNAKKNRAAEEEINQIRQELMSRISAPTFKDIWFVRLPYGMFCTVMALPACVRELLAKREVSAADNDQYEEPVRPKRAPRQRKPVKAAKLVDRTAPVVTNLPDSFIQEDVSKQLNEGNWNEDELANLIRLLKKYPIGSINRWEKIAETLNRSQQDVLGKVKSMRATKANVILDQQNSSRSRFVEGEISTKELNEEGHNESVDSGGGGELDPSDWTWDQQRQLEQAIMAHPRWMKGRWDLIATQVEGKSKHACIRRVKYLIDCKKQADLMVLEAETLRRREFQ